MLADRTDFRRFLTDDNVSAVDAFPDDIAVLGEYAVALDVGEKLAVAFLVSLFNGTNSLEQCSDLREALFLCLPCKFLIHIRPLVILAGSSIAQVLCRFRHTAVEQLEPDLCVLLFIVSGFLKELSDLDIAVFFCLGGVERILGVSL